MAQEGRPTPRLNHGGGALVLMTLTVESRAWPDVVEFYRELVDESGWDLGPMLGLIEFLASSPYAAGLFPATSMARLCLGRTRDIRWGHEMLTVSTTRPHDAFPSPISRLLHRPRRGSRAAGPPRFGSIWSGF